MSYIKKVNELEKERTLRTEFFTNIVEELEKEKISLISEKNSLKETSLKRKSNVNEVFEEKNKYLVHVIKTTKFPNSESPIFCLLA